MFEGLYGLCFNLGRAARFLGTILYAFPRRRIHVRGFLQQMYLLGNETLMIILVAGAFIGMVITLQGHISLSKYGAASEIGGLTAYSVYRELGPVVTALLFTGRVGSLLASEISMMQINEQFRCLQMMAINPSQLILFPRFFAVVVSVPILTVVFSLSAVLSSYAVCVYALGVPEGLFWNSLEYQSIFTLDVLHGLLKSVFFGVMIGWVALCNGNYAERTRVGMAQATTSTVVNASLLILGIDYVVTAFMGV